MARLKDAINRCPALIISVHHHLSYNYSIHVCAMTSRHLLHKVIPVGVVTCSYYLIRLHGCIFKTYMYIDKHALCIIADLACSALYGGQMSLCESIIMCTSWIAVCNASFFCILAFSTSSTAGLSVEQQEMTSCFHDIVFSRCVSSESFIFHL